MLLDTLKCKARKLCLNKYVLIASTVNDYSKIETETGGHAVLFKFPIQVHESMSGNLVAKACLRTNNAACCVAYLLSTALQKI